jgi:hypothetical protein
MPLLRFDLIEGRSEPEIRKILDTTHEVLLEALEVPKHDLSTIATRSYTSTSGLA